MHTLVYACDENYASLTAISAVSALEYNPDLAIVLLGSSLSPAAIEKVRTRIEAHGGKFRYFDVSERLRNLSEKGLCPYTSYAAYSRLFIAELLPEEEGRVLYLDCDTLVKGSLDELFAFDLKGKAFAFAYDCIEAHYRRYVKVGEDEPYFNSGVMLADLGEWRRSGASAILERELANPRGPNPLGDQDMIVRAWKDLFTPLPPKWNFLSQYFLFSYDRVRKICGVRSPWSSREEYDESIKSPIIFHFSGHTLGRPWFTSSRHPLRGEYIAAAKAADLEAAAFQKRKTAFPYFVQYCLWKNLPRVLFEPIAGIMYRLHIALTYHV